MKKISFLLAILALSGCSINIAINNNGDVKNGPKQIFETNTQAEVSLVPK